MNLRQKNKRLKKELERYKKLMDETAVPTNRVVIGMPKNVQVLRAETYYDELLGCADTEKAIYDVLKAACKYVTVNRVRDIYTNSEKLVATLLVVENDMRMEV